MRRHIRLVLPLLMLVLLLAGCTGVAPTTTPTPSPSPTPTPTPTVLPTYSLPQLEYKLFANFGDVFWCDPDFYPIGRPGQEETNSAAQFPSISGNVAEFTAILEQLGLSRKPDYTNDEKLSIYREHKKLTYAAQMAASPGIYQFTLRTGQGQGSRIEGAITPSGQISVLKTEPSFNTCPICLAQGTLIDTPSGVVPVEDLRVGMVVWTVDKLGNRIAVPIVETHATPVPPTHQVVKLVLDDGRSVTASPGHPSAEGKALGDYRVGEMLDGSAVVSAERIEYSAGATYDILPAGGTGQYWSNGILLGSTLTGN